MTTEPDRPLEPDLEDTGLGPADHADPRHAHPHERQGYEGSGLGPEDHADPDVVHTEREGYEGEGLGPHDHRTPIGSDEELED
jgi:hypothetical protein